MIQKGDLIMASDGKALKTPNGISTVVSLGTFRGYKDGKPYEITINLEDIVEVTPVRILNEVFYIEANDYSKAVTELIRQKYSLDAELALHANAITEGITPKMEAFLAWRIRCKEAAKKIWNE
jgi:hypothetical protein